MEFSYLFGLKISVFSVIAMKSAWLRFTSFALFNLSSMGIFLLVLLLVNEPVRSETSSQAALSYRPSLLGQSSHFPLSSNARLKDDQQKEAVADQLVELMESNEEPQLFQKIDALRLAFSALYNHSLQLFERHWHALDTAPNVSINASSSNAIVNKLVFSNITTAVSNRTLKSSSFLRSTSDFPDLVRQQQYEHVLHQWEAFGFTMQALSDSLVQQLVRSMIENHHMDVSRLSSGCTLALLQSLSALKLQKLWVMKMLDASSKFGIHSFMEGSIVDLGGFDQCLNVQSPVANDNSKFSFIGQYCLLKTSLPLPPKPEHLTMQTQLFDFSNTSLKDTAIQDVANFAHALYEHKIRLAFCLPSTCSEMDVQRLLESSWPSAAPPAKFSSCQTRHMVVVQHNLLSGYLPLSINNVQLTILFVYVLLLLLTFLGTLLEILMQRQQRISRLAHRQLQQQFSLNYCPPWPNVRRSLDQQPKTPSKSLPRSAVSVGNLNTSIGTGFNCGKTPFFNQFVVDKVLQPFATGNLDKSLQSSSNSNTFATNSCSFEPLSVRPFNALPTRTSLDASCRRRQFQMINSKLRHSLDQQPNQLLDDSTVTIKLFGMLLISNNGKLVQAMLSFSLITNLKQLFFSSNAQHDLNASTSTPTQLQISCLHGLRVLSMAWIILTHTYLLPIKSTLAYSRQFLRVSESAWFQLIINGWVLVDSFFFISAFLLTTNQMRLLFRTNGRINFVRVFLARLLRVAPSAWFLLSVMFLMPVFAPRGPLWDDYIGEQLRYCSTDWWANLIFVNNWLPYERMCMLHTWYLSADIQLFVGSLFFLLPMFVRPRLGLLLLVITAITSSVATFVYTYTYQLPPTVIYHTPSELEVLRTSPQVYTITFAHVGPYCIGMITGVLLHNRPHVRIPVYFRIIGWLFSCVGFLAVLLCTQQWNLGTKWTPLGAALYACLHRICWALCLAWVTFACVTGNASLVNSFLSWKIFEPLSKLSFMIYLVHFPLLWLRLSYARSVLPFGHYTMVCEFIVNFWLSVLVAIIPHLLIEVPAYRLYRVLFSRLFEFATFEMKPHMSSVANRNRIMDSVQFTSIKDFS